MGAEQGRNTLETCFSNPLQMKTTQLNGQRLTILTLLMLCFIHLNVFAQNEFQTVYGTGPADFGISAFPTADGGYAISGSSYGDMLGSGYVNNVIIKTDMNGVTQWVHAADTNSSNRTNVLVEDPLDNGLIVAGYTEGGAITNYPRANAWIYKVNSAGTVVWSNHLGGDNNNTTSYDDLDDVIATSDGNFIAVGYTDGGSYTGDLGGYDITAHKFDSNGNILWTRVIGTNLYEWGQCIIEASDGNYLIGGMRYDFSNFDAYLVKMSPAGTVLWANAYGGSGRIELGSIITNYGNIQPSHSTLTETADGGFVAVGYTNSFGAGGDDMYVMKVNATGTLQWAKTYGSTGNESASGVIETTNGDLLIAGSALGAMSGSNNDVVLMKLDANGNVLWTQTYEANAGGGPNEFVGGMALAADGRKVVITGAIDNATTQGYDMFLMKIDTGGTVAPCAAAGVLLPTSRTPTVNTITGSIVVTAGGSSAVVTTSVLASGNHGFGAVTETNTCLVPGGLPVEWLGFDVTAHAGKAQLEWQTATEFNNMKFIVEHATAADGFQPIGEVEGNGNTSNLSSYVYDDASPARGINYYRLRQVDYDGKEALSIVKSVIIKEQNLHLQSYPNPSSNAFAIRLNAPSAGNVEVAIHQASGNRIVAFEKEVTEGRQSIHLEAAYLKPGIYLVRVAFPNGNSASILHTVY